MLCFKYLTSKKHKKEIKLSKLINSPTYLLDKINTYFPYDQLREKKLQNPTNICNYLWISHLEYAFPSCVSTTCTELWVLVWYSCITSVQIAARSSVLPASLLRSYIWTHTLARVAGWATVLLVTCGWSHPLLSWTLTLTLTWPPDLHLQVD